MHLKLNKVSILTKARDWLVFPMGKPVDTGMERENPSSNGGTNSVATPGVVLRGRKGSQPTEKKTNMGLLRQHSKIHVKEWYGYRTYCMYAHTHKYTHTHIHTHTQIYTHKHTHTHTHTHTQR